MCCSRTIINSLGGYPYLDNSLPISCSHLYQYHYITLAPPTNVKKRYILSIYIFLAGGRTCCRCLDFVSHPSET